MLLKLILPLATFAAFRVVMYSDQPELVELRAQLYAFYTDAAASTEYAADKDRTDLQKLHDRTAAAAAAPCTEVVCPGGGPPADQIKAHMLGPIDNQRNLKPKFVLVAPAN